MEMSEIFEVAEYTTSEVINHGEHEFRIVPSAGDRIQIKIGDHLILYKVLYLEHRVTRILTIPLETRLLDIVVIVERIED